MLLIAVIDRRSTMAVWAQKGRSRGCYPFLSAPFMPQLRHVVSCLYHDYGFRSLYIADLDALVGRRLRKAGLFFLARRFPAVTFYIDGGFGDVSSLRRFLHGCCRNIVPVVATECLRDVPSWLRMCRMTAGRLVLSLDYCNNRLLGDTHIDNVSGLWSRDVLCMMLHAIGSASGSVAACGLRVLERNRRRATARQGNMILAGGIGSTQQLQDVSALGFTGVCLASSLYGGLFSSQQIKKWNRGLAL